MELGGCDFFDLTNGRRVRDPLLRRDYFRQMCLCTLQLHQVRMQGERDRERRREAERKREREEERGTVRERDRERERGRERGNVG